MIGLINLARPVAKNAGRFWVAGTSASAAELRDLETQNSGHAQPTPPSAPSFGNAAENPAAFCKKGSNSSVSSANGFVRKGSSNGNGFVRKGSSNSLSHSQQQYQQYQQYYGYDQYQYPQNQYQWLQSPAENPAVATESQSQTGQQQTQVYMQVPYQSFDATEGNMVSFPLGFYPAYPVAYGRMPCAPTWQMFAAPGASQSSSSAPCEPPVGSNNGVASAQPSSASSSAKPVVPSRQPEEHTAASVRATQKPSADAVSTSTRSTTAASTPTEEGARTPPKAARWADMSGDECDEFLDEASFQKVLHCRMGASRRRRRRGKAAVPTGMFPADGAASAAEVAELRRAVENVRQSRGDVAPFAQQLEEIWQAAAVPLPRTVADGATVSRQGSSTSLERAASSVVGREGSSSPRTFWPATPQSTPPQSPRASDNAAADRIATMENVGEDESEKRVDDIVAQLANGGAEVRSRVLDRVVTSLWPLASQPGGCRVVQKALEVADAPVRLSVAQQLQGHVLEAVASPHANHVLQKCIVMLPAEQVSFILEELKGNAATVARHRYGCRVIERLIEHSSQEDVKPLVDEVLSGTDKLCRHAFGNFVIQHILEHGTDHQRQGVAAVLCQDAVRFAKHRVASHVVKAALQHCGTGEREKLVQALTADPVELSELAHHHCGSFVVRELRRVGMGSAKQ
eukprot:TRINITY_DN37620_c0_g1_i1.p1 TRINITY_DN37620_c0_g1~~TRINITY_DN37620_c0_g1_i1.p1  ORF type:complete len:686 (-),score=129.74 TRINITY_DN37620_c0_g1_i1:125-2182(-)